MLAPLVISMLAPHENSTPTQRVYDCRRSALAETDYEAQESEMCILQVCRRGSRCHLDLASRPYARRTWLCYDV